MKVKLVYLILLGLLSALATEPLLVFYSGSILLYVYQVGWRMNEPKHLFVNLILYWLVVSILIPYAEIVSKPLNQLYVYDKGDIRLASWIGLTALLFYVLGLHVNILKIKTIDLDLLSQIAKRYDGKRLALSYAFISVFSVLINNVIIFIPGGQILLVVFYMKWILLTFLIIHAVNEKTNRVLVFGIVIFEILLSFSGFWAAFKDYILVIMGAVFFFSHKISFKSFLYTTSVLLVTVFISVIWTYSKGEYRKYLTGGERSQIVVQQDQFSNINKFIEIVGTDFSQDKFQVSFSSGLESLIHRISYVEFLALTLKQVPVYIPHENGQLLQNAVDHIIKPRFLYPDKKPIYDSELTSKYTGVQFAGADQGTSFSLGTVAEAYIDYGYIFMYIPLVIFGFWIGWMYRYFIVHGYNIIWGLCYSAPIFQFAWSFPVPTSKFLGWSITYFIGLWFLNKYLVKYLDNFLLKK